MPLFDRHPPFDFAAYWRRVSRRLDRLTHASPKSDGSMSQEWRTAVEDRAVWADKVEADVSGSDVHLYTWVFGDDYRTHHFNTVADSDANDVHLYPGTTVTHPNWSDDPDKQWSRRLGILGSSFGLLWPWPEASGPVPSDYGYHLLRLSAPLADVFPLYLPTIGYAKAETVSVVELSMYDGSEL